MGLRRPYPQREARINHLVRRRKWLLVGIIGLALAQCGVWFLAVGIAWSFRYLMVGPGSPVAASRTRFAIALSVGLGINVIALLLFLFRRHGWGRLFLVAVQAANVLFSLVLIAAISFDWLDILLFTLPATATLTMLFALRSTEPAITTA